MNWSLESSIFLRQLRNLKSAYLTVEEKISSIYLDSFSHRLIKKMNEKIKVCFRYSFLGMVTEIKEANPAVLNNSRVVRYLIDFYKRRRNNIIYYSKTSSTVNLTEDTKEQLILSPAKIISTIIVTAILVNVALSIILQKQISLWGWLIRGLFLFAGTSGLFCQADWSTVKESSVFLGKMQR